MKIDFDELPDYVQYIYLGITKIAITFKKEGHDREDFLKFCKEAWDSMEMNNIDELDEIISEQVNNNL